MTLSQWAELEPFLEETLAAEPGLRKRELVKRFGDIGEFYWIGRRVLDMQAFNASLAKTLKDPEQRWGPCDVISGWRILYFLGHNGCAEEFLASRVDSNSDRVVMLFSADLESPTAAEVVDFRNEFQQLERLYDNCLGKILDAGIGPDNHPFLVSEFVAGIPIPEAAGAFDTRGIVELFVQVLKAVDYSHQRRVWHGYLRPENILMDEHSHLRLADFGCHRLLTPGLEKIPVNTSHCSIASLVYMSPERLDGKGAFVETDVYSLGIVLYQMLAGVPPFGLKAADASEAAQEIREKALPKINGLDSKLNQILQRALSKSPASRYPNLAYFAEDAGHYLAGRALRKTAGDEIAKLPSKHAGLEKAITMARRNAFAAICVLVVAATSAFAFYKVNSDQSKVAQIQNHTNQAFGAGILPGIGKQANSGENAVQSSKRYLDEMLEGNKHKPAVRQELTRAYLRLAEAEMQGFGTPGIDRGMAIQATRRAHELASLALDRVDQGGALSEQEALDYAQSSRMLTKLLRESKNYAEATRITEEWQKRLEKLPSSSPELAKAKASANSTMADLLFESGRQKDSLSSASKAMTQFAAVYQADPSNAANGRDYAKSAYSLGSKSLALDDLSNALKAFQSSEQVLRKQVDQPRPESAPLIDLAQTLVGLGEVLERSAQRRQALNSYREARRLLEQASKRGTGSEEATAALADNLTHTARFHLQTSSVADAEDDAEHAIEILRGSLSNLNTSPERRKQLARALSLKASILLSRRQRSEAMDVVQDSLAQWNNYARLSGLQPSEEQEVARLRALAGG